MIANHTGDLMNKYRLIFIGRAVNAIDVMGAHTVDIEAESEEAAVLKLYDTHEHIMRLQIRHVPEGTLYDTLKAAGVPLDHHESDLYVKANAESTKILETFGVRRKVFVSTIDGTQWYDVPFAYLPYWEARQQPKESKE